MQRSGPGFEASYRRHLVVEQRRAVLDALARSFAPDATVGEIVDAAAALGWADLGELSLSELADALLSEDAAAQRSAPVVATPVDDADEDEGLDDDDDDDADDDVDEGEPPAPPPVAARGAKPKAPATKATVAKPAAVVAAAKPQPAKPVKGKPGKPTKVSLDERMSLDEAAAVLLPLVQQIGEATMQQLEQSTAGAGRRKLRFHIGQLVKNGRLERHGMGRGTYYTLT